MKDLQTIAKELCDELGIAWDENAREATLNGEPVTPDILRDCLRAGFNWRDAIELSRFSELLGYEDIAPLLKVYEVQFDSKVQFDKE